MSTELHTNRDRGAKFEGIKLSYKGRSTTVRNFPIGIDPDEFKERFQSKETQELITRLEKQFEGQRIIVGVDRLDYIKGVTLKLHAFDKFLNDHPEWRDTTTLIQVAVPTRTNVKEYQKLRRDVNELVGKVNGAHSKQFLLLFGHFTLLAHSLH